MMNDDMTTKTTGELDPSPNLNAMEAETEQGLKEEPVSVVEQQLIDQSDMSQPGAYAINSRPNTSTSRLSPDSPVPVVEQPGPPEGLSVAQPVEEPSQMDLPYAEPQEITPNQRDTRPSHLVAILATAGLAIAIATVLAVSVSLYRKESDVHPTLIPSQAPTAREYLLPPDTRDKIQRDPASPQALAHDWLLDDVLIHQYSELRWKQRFALAALYFATDGPNWYHNQDWLNHSVHECQWWSQPTYQTGTASVPYTYFAITHSNPCEHPSHLQQVEEQREYRHLWLYDNNLQGSIPTEVFWLTSLRSVSLADNGITGIIPTELGHLGSLEAISLAGTSLTGGTIPTEIASLAPILRHVNVIYSGMIGTLPSELGNMTQLLELLLEYNAFTGTLPDELCQMKQLAIIYLSGNNLDGTVPECLMLLPLGDELYLEENLFSGTLPTTIGMATNLENFFIYSNYLTGYLPSELGQLTVMRYLYLESNAFSGTMPTELGRLEYLKGLYLHQNRLTGTIPTELGLLGVQLDLHPQYELQPMVDIDLGHNLLSGTIPTEFGNCVHLHGLSLNNNAALTGPIPSELGNLPSIEFLYLQSCKLTGRLPSELGVISNLQELDVSSNYLTGTIPLELEGMHNLTVFNISNTFLTGTVPDFLCDIPGLVLAFDCSRLLCGCHCACRDS